MRKFLILVKKEIQELLTPQMLVPLVAVVLVFVFIGKIMGNETAKIQAPQPVAVVDLDNSSLSQTLIETLGKNNISVDRYSNKATSQVIKEAKQKNEKAVLVIPSGFESGIKNFIPQKVEVYTILSNFSFLGSRASQSVVVALAATNQLISSQLISQVAPNANQVALKQPVLTNDFVIVGERQANVNPAVVSNFISSQTTFIPIILFLVIVFASQLIATSIASEKENKTLETLLSSPVSRKAVVAAKLVGAGLVSLLTAVVYLFGMRYYITGLTGSATSSAMDEATKTAVAQLGLTFGAFDYVLLGLTLFLGILAALSIAIILGSFAEDTKAAQGLIAPLMALVLIPYFLTLFLDISTLSPVLRWFVYAIPFSHPFLAAPNILLHQYTNVWYGILYLVVFFVVAVFIAAKIFSSDKIFTLKLKFGKKKGSI
jgi:ABC-2 type transport system permease protein